MIKDLKKELLIWAFGMLCIVFHYFFNVSFWLFVIGTYFILFIDDLRKGILLEYIALYIKGLLAISLFLFYKEEMAAFIDNILLLDRYLSFSSTQLKAALLLVLKLAFYQFISYFLFFDKKYIKIEPVAINVYVLLFIIYGHLLVTVPYIRWI